ncbi:MAG TPA: hypothetical protein VFW92_06070 [Candidatus Limnocylindrales bacterium]|nr:hypothetical protein [Candidatus Limnocylindrales bacterium]
MTRRVRVYAGPQCPDGHGPLLEVAGMNELHCPAQAHAVPGGRAWFTGRELAEAAAASASGDALNLGAESVAASPRRAAG